MQDANISKPLKIIAYGQVFMLIPGYPWLSLISPSSNIFDLLFGSPIIFCSCSHIISMITILQIKLNLGYYVCSISAFDFATRDPPTQLPTPTQLDIDGKHRIIYFDGKYNIKIMLTCYIINSFMFPI